MQAAVGGAGAGRTVGARAICYAGFNGAAVITIGDRAPAERGPGLWLC